MHKKSTSSNSTKRASNFQLIFMSVNLSYRRTLKNIRVPTEWRAESIIVNKYHCYLFHYLTFHSFGADATFATSAETTSMKQE